MSQNVIVFTGSGISAESGISTFRDTNGYWKQYNVYDVASPSGFQRMPEVVHEFYNMRRRDLVDKLPNKAHYALVRLEEHCKANNKRFLLITQNVDGLHRKAGSQNVLEIHGNLNKMFCIECGEKSKIFDDITIDSICSNCNRREVLRPYIVWFGETPMFGDEKTFARHFKTCDVFLSIGTSNDVSDGYGLYHQMKQKSKPARTVELNLEMSHGIFDEYITGYATETVPEYVKSIIQNTPDNPSD